MTPAMISACETHALNEMASKYPGVPVFMSGQAVPKEVSLYVRFWVIPSEEVMQMSISDDAKSRNVGIVQADVYGPKDKGAGETGNIAFALAQSFRRAPVEVPGEGWIVFKDAGVKDMNEVEESHRQMMRVPYRFDFVM